MFIDSKKKRQKTARKADQQLECERAGAVIPGVGQQRLQGEGGSEEQEGWREVDRNRFHTSYRHQQA